jgi:hypothetical protein
LPPGKLLHDVTSTYFNPDDEACEGQSDYDEDHCVGLTTISTEPEHSTAEQVVAAAEALLRLA